MLLVMLMMMMMTGVGMMVMVVVMMMMMLLVMLMMLTVGVLEDGNVDIEAIRNAAEKHKDNLAALMITYPSTHGVYETGVDEICNIIHANGGQVYMDGANMNAQVGLTSPGQIE